MEQQYGYIGFKVAVSLTRRNAISNYWWNRMLLSQSDSSAVMSQDDYMRFRTGMRFYPTYIHDVSIRGLSWHSCTMFNHFR